MTLRTIEDRKTALIDAITKYLEENNTSIDTFDDAVRTIISKDYHGIDPGFWEYVLGIFLGREIHDHDCAPSGARSPSLHQRHLWSPYYQADSQSIIRTAKKLQGRKKQKQAMNFIVGKLQNMKEDRTSLIFYGQDLLLGLVQTAENDDEKEGLFSKFKNFLVYYATPNSLVNFVKLGWKPQEMRNRLDRMDYNIDHWAIEGICTVLTPEERTHLFEKDDRSIETSINLINYFKLEKEKYRDFLTDKLFSDNRTSLDIAHTVRQNPDYYDMKEVQRRLSKLIKEEMRSSPEEMAGEILGLSDNIKSRRNRMMKHKMMAHYFGYPFY